jgi:hypothetical protein
MFFEIDYGLETRDGIRYMMICHFKIGLSVFSSLMLWDTIILRSWELD